MALSLDRLLADSCDADARHKVCRSRGGESCAFDGAAIVLMPIADAAHVVHGPIACCGNAWEGRGVHSAAGEMHRRGFTTDLGELDIVYGGEERLAAAVREVVEREAPAAVFVYATCVTGLIGEDLDAVCARLSAELPVPVVPVNAPGFVGPKNLGNRIAGDVLVEHVIGTAEPPETTAADIALVGEYNVAGDLAFVEPLLAECGFRVLSRVTGGARFEEVRWAHRARVAALVCGRALVNVAATLTRRWGVPHVEVSFFGATETARSLRALADALEARAKREAEAAGSTGVGASGLHGLRKRVDAVIAEREASLREALEPYAGLRGVKAVLYSGGVKSWSMAAALRDLGVEVVAVGTKKSSVEDEAKAREVLGPGVPLIEDVSPGVLRRLMAEGGGQVLVAGGRNRYLAAKEGWPFVDVNQEREHAYAGYEGLVALARDLQATLRFHERQRASESAALAAERAPTPRVRVEARSCVTDPLKNAPTLGAVLALQGVEGVLPVLHAAQGCSFLGKVLAIRHFNEPIALATSRLFTEDVVLASEEAAAAAVRRLAEASRPALVALVTGALAEVKGDDVEAAVRRLRAELAAEVVAVRAPDYQGGLEEGYAAAVEALAELAAPPAGRPARLSDPLRVTILAGAHLTPGDARWLREAAEAFGLAPVLLPDLGALDGSREGFSALASGGTPLGEIRALGHCAHALVLGASLEPVARSLRERFGTPYTVLPAAHGLSATDTLLAELARVSGLPVPPRLARERYLLVDAMRDAHLEFAGARVALALEPDHALSLSALLAEVAVVSVTAVVPTRPPHLARIAAEDIVVGDLASVPEGVDLLVGSSHAARTAAVRGAAHLECGFPVFARYGAAREVTVGYAGATALVDAAANLLGARHRTRHPAAPVPAPLTEGAPR